MPHFLLAPGTASLQDRALAVVVLTIGGILAACILFALFVVVLRMGHSRAERRRLALSRVWEPALLEILAGATEPDALADRIAPRDRFLFLDFLLTYARRIRGPERAVLSRLARPHIQAALPLLRRRSAEQRARAVQMLSVLGMAEHSAEVVRALDDASPVVAMMAARELARPEHPDYGPVVLQRAERFEAWSPDHLATMFAGVGPSLCPELRATLADPERAAWVRTVAADALALLNDAEAADIAAAFDDSEDSELLAAACRVLRAVGRPAHATMLRRMLDSPYAHVRMHAAAALGVTGSVSDAGILERALDDENSWVALHAARSLAELAGPERLRTLEPGHRRAVLLQEVLSEVA